MKTTPFVPAKSKVEAVARLYAAAQAPYGDLVEVTFQIGQGQRGEIDGSHALILP